MTGSGFMSAAMKSFKLNRALLKKDSGSFDISKIRTLGRKPLNQYKKYHFKEATPSCLKEIKNQAQKERAMNRTKAGITLIISLVLTICFFQWLNTL